MKNKREYMRAWRAAHKVYRAAYMNRWNAEHPELAKATDRRKYLKNREKKLSYQARYYNDNRERIAEYNRLNPDRHREAKYIRRARKYGNGPIERIYRKIVWERDRGVCGICCLPADKANWHLDHKIALARGGTHTYRNVQVAHPSCNMKKGVRAT